MRSIPFLILLHLVLFKAASAVEGGEGTYALAHITGPQIIENSTHIPTGYYTFRHVETGQYLQFIDSGNQIVPARADSANATAFNGTMWTVKWHGDKNYSIHHLNGVKYDKCVSTRWDHLRGLDDAAVMWQCEVDNVTRNDLDFDIYPGFRGVYNASDPHPLERRQPLQRRYENTYEAIRQDKQQWLFMRYDPSETPHWTHVRFDPDTGENRFDGGGKAAVVQPNRKKNRHSGSNQFYIVSAAHLWNMKPRCIYPQASYEFTFTPNNTGVTALDHCVWGNTSQLWEATLWKPANFPLGIEPDPRFVDNGTDAFLLWDAHSSPGTTILWWACLVVFSFIAWIWQH